MLYFTQKYMKSELSLSYGQRDATLCLISGTRGESLENRRIDARLAMFYKITYGLQGSR